MRTALLFALSTIRNHNGHTPVDVIRALLLFAENNVNLPSARMHGAGGGDDTGAVSGSDFQGNSEVTAGKITFAQKTPEGFVYDDSHYKAALLLALSRVRVDPNSTPKTANIPSSSSSSSSTISPTSSRDLLIAEGEEDEEESDISTLTGANQLRRIATLARDCLQREFVHTKSKARTLRDLERIQRLRQMFSASSGVGLGAAQYSGAGKSRPRGFAAPELPAGGIVAAAAITCMSEMDVQLISAGVTTKAPTTNTESVFECMPPGIGNASGTPFDYTMYFLPLNETLHHQHQLHKNDHSQDHKKGHHNPQHQQQIPSTSSLSERTSIFSLCALSTAVREAALEAFVRVCFAQYLAVVEIDRQRRAKPPASTTAHHHHPPQPQPQPLKLADISSYAAVAVEAVLAVLRSDPHRSVRRNASVTLSNAVQNSPAGQHTFAAYSRGEPWLCVGWADPDGVTSRHAGGISSAIIAAKTGKEALEKHPLLGRRKVNGLLKLGLLISAQGHFMTSVTKELWRKIRKASAFDQVRVREKRGYSLC